MDEISNWRINLHEITTQTGVTVPAAAILVVDDRPIQCDQIILDLDTQNHVVVAENRLYKLGHPLPVWRDTLYRAGRSVLCHLLTVSRVLDDIQRLNVRYAN